MPYIFPPRRMRRTITSLLGAGMLVLAAPVAAQAKVAHGHAHARSASKHVAPYTRTVVSVRGLEAPWSPEG